MNQDFVDLELENEPWNSTSAAAAAAAAADSLPRSPVLAEEQLMQLIWQNGAVSLPLGCPPTTAGYGDDVGLAEAVDRLLREEDDELASWLNDSIDVIGGSGEGNELIVREEADAMMTMVGSNATPTAAGADQGWMVAGQNETPLRTSASSWGSNEKKRKKARGAEEREPGHHAEQWKDAEFNGSSERRKGPPRCASVRKLRSAELHNRSERRRRSRINTKMKALQELIPKCNKSDKASTLDEAIEYVKSLQLQVQMMSMGCNAGPQMFPGVHPCLTPMGMGMPTGLGMGMGMGMGPGMTTAGTKPFTGNPVYPMHQFGPLPWPTISGHPAVQLSPRPFMVPFCPSAVPAADRTRCEAINQQDHLSDAAKTTNSSAAPIPWIGDPYRGFVTLQDLPAQAQSPIPGEDESAKEVAAQKATMG